MAAVPVTFTEADPNLRCQAAVERFGDMVYHRCRRELSAADADDAAQAVFLVYWRRQDAPEQEAALAAWLLTVCRNVIRNAKRDSGRRRRAERGAGQEQGPRFVDEGKEPADQQQLHRLALQAIDALPRQERVAIELHVMADLTYAAIAKQTGSRTSTVAARVQRGLGRVRQQLGRRGHVLGLTALLALLQNQAMAAAPAHVLAAMSQLPASVTDGEQTTAQSLTTVIRWSHMENSRMFHYSLLTCLLGSLALLCTTPWLQGQDQNPDPTASEPAASTISTDAAIIIRVNDPARSWQRLQQSPYAVLLPEAWQQRIKTAVQGSGPAWLVMDPNSSMSPEGRAQQRRIEEAIQNASPKDFNKVITEEVQKQIQQQLENPPAAPSLFFDVQAKWEKPDLASAGELLTSVTALLPQDKIRTLSTNSYESSSADGQYHFGLQEAALYCTGTSKRSTGDLSWLTTPPQASYPQADIEIHSLLRPLDAKRYAEWSGWPQQDTHKQSHVRLSFTDRGLDFVARARYPDNPIGRASQQLPQLQPDCYDQVPADALFCLAYALKPDSFQQDGLFMGIRAGMMASPAEPGSKAHGLLSLLTATMETFDQADGALLLYAQAAPGLPALTLQCPIPQAKIQALQQRVQELQLGQARGKDVYCSINPMVGLYIGWRDGTAYFTSHPQGLDAIRATPKGFSTKSDVVAAVAALQKQQSSVSAIFRHQALMQYLVPLVGMRGDPNLSGRAQAFAEKLSAESSWFRMGYDQEGLHASGSGALNALLLPAMIGIVGPSLNGYPSGIN